MMMEKNIDVTYVSKKSLSIFLSLLLFLSYFAPYGYGADLDGLYQPLLEGDRFLYKTQAYLFDLDDRGVHGGANFDRFDADPYFLTFGKVLRFSPISPVEIELGYNEALHTDYKRSTYHPTGSMTSVQKYNIDYFRNFNSSVRIRMGSSELYFDFLEKRQKANRNSAL